MWCAFIICSTYEVATACALAIEADKLICIIDGPILDECGRLIHFLTLQEADKLIRKRAKQSEIAASYVKVVDEGGLSSLGHNGSVTSQQNGKALREKHGALFQNGVGFDSGNGEQGFAIGGQERLSRLNGYLSELAAAAFVCRVSPCFYELLSVALILLDKHFCWSLLFHKVAIEILLIQRFFFLWLIVETRLLYQQVTSVDFDRLLTSEAFLGEDYRTTLIPIY